LICKRPDEKLLSAAFTYNSLRSLFKPAPANQKRQRTLSNELFETSERLYTHAEETDVIAID
jgi:hypothetical protein